MPDDAAVYRAASSSSNSRTRAGPVPDRRGQRGLGHRCVHHQQHRLQRADQVVLGDHLGRAANRLVPESLSPSRPARTIGTERRRRPGSRRRSEAGSIDSTSVRQVTQIRPIRLR